MSFLIICATTGVLTWYTLPRLIEFGRTIPAHLWPVIQVFLIWPTLLGGIAALLAAICSMRVSDTILSSSPTSPMDWLATMAKGICAGVLLWATLIAMLFAEP